MPIGILYWVILVVWVLFGLWRSNWDVKTYSPNLVLIVLLILIGWQLFGPVVRK